MAWLFLIGAGVIEIGWAISLKYTEGFTRFWPSVGMLAAAIAGFFFLSTALNPSRWGPLTWFSRESELLALFSSGCSSWGSQETFSGLGLSR